MDRINRGPIGHDAGDDGRDGMTEPFDDDATDVSKRRRVRDSLLLIARLQVDGAATVHEVRVRNLSEGGLMIEFDRALAVDTPITLDIRGIGETHGRIAWCTEGRMGIALDAPIDPKKARKPVSAGTTTPVFAKPILFRAPRAR